MSQAAVLVTLSRKPSGLIGRSFGEDQWRMNLTGKAAASFGTSEVQADIFSVSLLSQDKHAFLDHLHCQSFPPPPCDVQGFDSSLVPPPGTEPSI